MVSMFAIERTLSWYVFLIIVLAINANHVPELYLKIINWTLLFTLSILFLRLYNEWARLKYELELQDTESK